jgi:hypothetical protein
VAISAITLSFRSFVLGRALAIARQRFAFIDLIFGEVPVLVTADVPRFVGQVEFLALPCRLMLLCHACCIPARMVALPGCSPAALNSRHIVLPFAMLLGRASKPPMLPEWSFEVKYDGWRCIAEIHRQSARLWSRNGNDLTARFPEFSHLHKLVAPSIIDILRASGRSVIARTLEQRRTILKTLVPSDFSILLRSKPFGDTPSQDLTRRCSDKC